jgi:hypothetical protein
MMWPVVDGYNSPNAIVYDKGQFEDYLSFNEDRAHASGVGPLCEMNVGDTITRFRSGIDYAHVGTRFHIEHLRKFLRARIDGTKKVYSDERCPTLNPFEQDVVYCVGLVQDAHAKPALTELNSLLSDRNKDIRVVTIWAIGSFGAEAVDSISGLASSLETDVARAASRALARIGDAAIPALTKKMVAGGTDARIYSIEALGVIGPPAASAVDELIEALHEKKHVTDRSGYISSYAADALGKIGDKRALPHLRAMQSARNHDVRNLSRRAIDRIEADAEPKSVEPTDPNVH